MRNTYIYIFAMAAVTFLIRVLPLTLIRREIKNKTIRSFLYYVPYVTLAVMTFPSIVSATQEPIAALLAFAAAIALAWRGKSLFTVSVLSCVVVFVCEAVLKIPAVASWWTPIGEWIARLF